MKLARRIVPGLASDELVAAASSAGVRFDGQAHRAEADEKLAGLVADQLATRLAARFSLADIDPGLLVVVGNGRAAEMERLVSAYGKEARGRRVVGRRQSRTEGRAATAATTAVSRATVPVGPAAVVRREGDKDKRAPLASPQPRRPGWKWIRWLKGK